MNQFPDQGAGPPRGPPHTQPRRGRELAIHDYVQAARERLDSGNYSRTGGLAQAAYPDYPPAQGRINSRYQIPVGPTTTHIPGSRLQVRQQSNESLTGQYQYRRGTPRTRVLAAAESRYQNYASFAPQPNRAPGNNPARPREYTPRPHPGNVPLEHGLPGWRNQPTSTPPLRFTSRDIIPASSQSNLSTSNRHSTEAQDAASFIASGPTPTPTRSISRASLTQVAQVPSVPAIPEEAGSRKSVTSSITSSNASAVLYPASESERVYSGISDFLDGYGDRSSPLPTHQGHGEELVREASVSQRQKATVTEVSIPTRKDDSDEPKPEPLSGVIVEASTYHNSGIADAAEVEANQRTDRSPVAASSQMPKPSPFGQSASLESMDSTTPESSPSSPNLGLSKRESRSRSPLVPAESRFSQSLGQPGVVGADESPDTENFSRRDTFRGRPRSRVPQSFDVDAMKDAEVRASMTSLRGLILRNLRLASNLERGVTSSRFGLDWIINAEENSGNSQARASRASLLNLFPSTPQGQSPHADDGQLPLSAWHEEDRPRSTTLSAMYPPDTQQVKNQRKQCCGLPRRTFIVIVILLVLLIAAAIIVPVALIVIPHQNQNDPRSTPKTAGDLGSCHQQLDCGARGSKIQSGVGSACRCLCIDGWTGEACSFHDVTGCVTMDVAQTANATAGSMIAPLLRVSMKTFNIALDPVTILSLFSKANLTCASENDLMSLGGGLSQRSVPRFQRRAISKAYVEEITVASVPMPNEIWPRQPHRAVTNGIIYAQSTVSTESAVASPTMSPPAPHPTDFDPTSHRTIEFAQIAILYILQSSTELSTATISRSKFEQYFSAPENIDPTKLSLGGGWIVNLVDCMVWYSGV